MALKHVSMLLALLTIFAQLDSAKAGDSNTATENHAVIEGPSIETNDQALAANEHETPEASHVAAVPPHTPEAQPNLHIAATEPAQESQSNLHAVVTEPTPEAQSNLHAATTEPMPEAHMKIVFIF